MAVDAGDGPVSDEVVKVVLLHLDEPTRNGSVGGRRLSCWLQLVAKQRFVAACSHRSKDEIKGTPKDSGLRVNISFVLRVF